MKWLGPVVVVALAVLAELTLGRAGSGPELALFFGRFHPLVVHLPIGFFLLVALAEAATFLPKLRDRVEPAVGLLVPVSALAALAAFLMGQLLALEGGFPAAALGWHRRLTLLAVMGMAACWVLYERQRSRAGQGRLAYRGALAITLGLLSLGAHFGGTMTRGESYLSKYAPGPLKPLLGSAEPSTPAPERAAGAASAAPTSEPLVYEHVVQPLLRTYCVECHGTEKQKGKLRMDSLELLLKGGESGAAVVPGDPKKSLLVTRMLLPPADDDHMPPEGKPSPKPEELALLQFWIERGATATLKVRDALAPAVSRSLLEHALGGTPPSSSVPVSAPSSAPGTTTPDSAPGSAPGTATPDSAPGSAPGTATPDSAPGSAKAVAPTGDPSPRALANEPPAGSVPPSSPATTPGTTSATSSPDRDPATSPASLSPRAATVSSGTAFLATYCEKCHGASKQKGKLRVDSLAALVKGGANGAALVPGKPEQSSLVQRVRLALDNDDHMPPKKEPQPTASEVAVLAAWIRGGASTSGASTSGVSTSSASTSSASTSSASTSGASTSGASSTGVANSGKPTAGPPSTTPVAAGTANDPSASSPSSTPSSPAPAVGAVADVSGPPEPSLLQTLPPEVALFSAAVQPILREKCGKCHIRDKPAGGLGVEGHAQLLEGGFSGAGIVPKNRQASFVMQRLTLPTTDDEHMPPEGEPALSPDEIELVGAWIDQGAPASAPTETAKLTAGAARALSARGIKGGASGPPPLAAQSGGCGACSVPGAPRSRGLALQVAALLGASLVLTGRRLRRLTPS